MLWGIMPRVRVVALVLVAAATAAGCRVTPAVALQKAEAERQAGRAAQALVKFDAIAARKDASDVDRIAANLGAVRACDALRDETCARAHLERAIAKDVPGEIEPALFELAERIVNEDHGRALNLYYRAAGGAEKYRARGWPYKAAMDRILQISMSR
jgi:hypothetical protein